MFKYFIQGGLIGIGNIIPGVSGATVALILGIFKRLMQAINAVEVKTVLSLFKIFSKDKSEFFDEMKRIDFVFLATVAVGALSFIYIFSFAMSYLLNTHHDATYSFFFGLILASVLMPIQLIKEKVWYGWLLTLLAIFFVVFLSMGITEEEQVNNYVTKKQMSQGVTAVEYDYSQLGYYFAAGAISISAMILPGISGSFVLLLMGSYFDILAAIKQLQIPILASFGAGCFLGLILFARLLQYFLDRYESQIMFFLTGLILGSLYTIWPFKNKILIETTTIYGENIVPDVFTMGFGVCFGVFLLGFVLVFGFYLYEKKKA